MGILKTCGFKLKYIPVHITKRKKVARWLTYLLETKTCLGIIFLPYSRGRK